MARLYGVMHGGWLCDIFSGHTSNLRIRPTEELLESLAQLPRGSNMGIESLSHEDKEEVNNHLSSLPFNPPEPRFSDDYPQVRPYYNEESTEYWKVLEERCKHRGLNVVYLEDKNLWFTYNKATIRVAENKAKWRNLFVKEWNESQEAYDMKRIRMNHERHCHEIRARKIHEIERDNALLRNIHNAHLHAVVVGLGHSEYWTANRALIEQQFGVSFEGYSCELPTTKDNSWRGATVFVEHASPDPKQAFERESLERARKILETGRLTEREPAYVGTWDVDNPCEGYFEVFVREENGKFQGEMIDALGDAEVEGTRTATELRFAKRYREDQCSTGAARDEILYRGIIKGNEITGFYALRGYGKAMYMTPERPKGPVYLGLSWAAAVTKYGEEIKAFGKRLFEE